MSLRFLPILALAGPAYGPLTADDPPPEFVPSAVRAITTSVFAPSTEATSLLALHFGSAHEQDVAVLRGEQLGLLYRPARLETYYALANGVQAMAAVPMGDGTEGLVVATSGGLELLAFRGDASGFHSTATLSSDPRWGATRGLWVQRGNGEQAPFTVYGAVESDLLTATFDGGGWTFAQLPAAEVHGLAWLDFDGLPGDEIVWLLPSWLIITDASAQVIHAALPAGSADRIAILRGVPGATPDRLVRKTAGVSESLVEIIRAGPEQGFPEVAVHAVECTDLLVLQYSVEENGLELFLPASSGATARLHTVDEQGNLVEPAPTQFTNLGTNRVLADLNPLTLGDSHWQAGAVGDFDDDELDDVVWVDEDGVLRFWFGHPSRMYESWASLIDDVPWTESGPGVGTELNMVLYKNVSVSTDRVRLRVKEVADDGSAVELVDALDQQGMATGSTDLYLFQIPVTGYGGGVLHVSVTPLEQNAVGIEDFGVSRFLVIDPGNTENDPATEFYHAISTDPQPGGSTGTRNGGTRPDPPQLPPSGG